MQAFDAFSEQCNSSKPCGLHIRKVTSTAEIPRSGRSTTFESCALNATIQPPLRLHNRPLLSPLGKLDRLHETSADRLLMTMSSLERILSENPRPLQEFSTLFDFSGENIAFLTRISVWWAAHPATSDHERKQDSFNSALEIYMEFVSPRDAEFPLNLPWADLKFLEEVFEGAARIICGEGRNDLARPFDFAPTPVSSPLVSTVQYTDEFPEGFCAGVFDDVQTHVKYLVFVNTWPKFVEAMQQPNNWPTPNFSYEQGTTDVAGRPPTDPIDIYGDFIKRGEWKRWGIVFDNKDMVG